MNPVSVYDARNRLGALLDAVERGQEVVITRRGKAVARLVPASHDAPSPAVDRPRAAVEALRALRAGIAARGVNFTRTESKALRDDGRR